MYLKGKHTEKELYLGVNYTIKINCTEVKQSQGNNCTFSSKKSVPLGLKNLYRVPYTRGGV